MKKLLTWVIIGALGLYGYQHYQRQRSMPSGLAIATGEVEPPTASAAQFRCDGRTYCSQMTSCEEAMFFLRNCPGVKMDGEGDGIPCEKQWCGQRR